MYLRFRQAGLALLTGATIWGAVNMVPAEAVSLEPPCGFDVYKGTLSVISLGVKGKVTVWYKDRVVREAKIKKDSFVDFPLKHRHTNKDFMIAIVKQGTTHNNETVWWCEPA
jgi:hypothetical protein